MPLLLTVTRGGLDGLQVPPDVRPMLNNRQGIIPSLKISYSKFSRTFLHPPGVLPDVDVLEAACLRPLQPCRQSLASA